jgi:hypothetical protein
VFSFAATVMANEGADLLSYLLTSELMLIFVTVLIALLLVARHPKERGRSALSEGTYKQSRTG